MVWRKCYCQEVCYLDIKISSVLTQNSDLLHHVMLCQDKWAKYKMQQWSLANRMLAYKGTVKQTNKQTKYLWTTENIFCNPDVTNDLTHYIPCLLVSLWKWHITLASSMKSSISTWEGNNFQKCFAHLDLYIQLKSVITLWQGLNIQCCYKWALLLPSRIMLWFTARN